MMSPATFIAPGLNILQWLTAFSLMGLAWYCHERRNARVARHLSIFFVLTAHWAFWAALIFLVPNLESKIFLNRIKLLSIPFIPLAMFATIYALQSSVRIPKLIWILAAVVPTATILITLSPMHELFVGQYRIENMMGHDFLAFSNGPWFFVHNLQSRLLAACCLTLLFASSTSHGLSHPPKRWLIFWALFVPFIADSLAVLYFHELRFIQITPSLLTVTAILMVRAIISDRILDVVPFARSLIIDATTDLHLVFNAEDELADCNRAACETLGLSRADLRRNLVDVVQSIPELSIPHPTIGDQYYETIKQPLLDNKSINIGTIITLKNVTAQQHLNKELRSIGEFKTKLMGVFGHDLRSHLAGISLLSESMTHQNPSPSIEELQTNAAYVHQSAQTSVAFVEQLLSWSKSQLDVLTVQRSPIDLRLLCKELVDFVMPIASIKNIGFKILSTDPCEIISDEQLIRIIIRNLLSNAIKFSPQDSIVDLRIANHEHGVDLSIVDHGIGMSAQKLSAIFKPDPKRSHGFGLMISQEFAHKLGGMISAQSHPQKGSTFTLHLPKNIP